jgi:asparagine synthase (glutamine-hydrolysing)
MCGIAGIVALGGAPAPTREALLRMAGALSHRGPDELGLYRDAGAGLAHARLSIIDLATGQQPMADALHTTWIVFNGEIFNYLELRTELAALGHRFRTRSDTEVIVQAWHAWGERAFERFNGQWAVALWDSPARRLVLARDPTGICPLHLCQHAGHLYFASEVKSIFAANPAIPRAFDPAGIEQTFTFWSVIPPQSVFKGVEELKPGHLRIYQAGSFKERSFYAPSYGGFSGSLHDAVESVRSAVEEATRLRMLRADVPVGSYLSGGLDSSLVAALGRRFAGERFQTFSLRFEDAEYDETSYQHLMAQCLGAEHHEVVVSRADIAAAFPQVIAHTERPILRTAPAPLYLLSGLVRRHGIKVVLTGEGADEMFAGYDLFREGKVRRFWARQPGSARRPRLLERLYPYLARSPVAQQAMARRFFGRNLAAHGAPGFAHDTRWHTTGALKRLLSPAMRTGRDPAAELLADLPAPFASWTSLAQDQYLEKRTLLAGYLLSSQGDRMLMAHSIEGRFPFLDSNVISLANSLPDSYKLRVLDEKHVLKRAAAGAVPAEILARKKQPYRAPDAAALFDAPYVDELLSESQVRETGVFEAQPVTQLLRKCRAHGAAQFSNADNMALVGILSTQLLHRQLVAQRPYARTDLKLRTDVDRTHLEEAA